MSVEISFQSNTYKKKDRNIHYRVSDTLNDVMSAFYSNPDEIEIKLIAKGKFSVWFSKKNTTLLVTSSDALFPVGLLYFKENLDRVWSTSLSWIHPNFQGQGIGLRMYETALHLFGILASSDSLSPGSAKTWQKLVKHYNGKLVIPARYSEGKNKDKTVVDIVGWETGPYPYPIVKDMEGNDISFRSLLKQKHKSSNRYAISDCYYLIEK